MAFPGEPNTSRDKPAPDDFRPTASLGVLRQRAELLAVVRDFFGTRGYWEVETPLLSRDVIVDVHLEPFSAPIRSRLSSESAEDGEELFLQTSPEFAMKRLLAAGAEAIYQITRAFRRGESGRWHNPEFTMLEWYRAGVSYRQQMDLVEELLVEVARRGRALRQQDEAGTTACRQAVPQASQTVLEGPFERITYDEAFQRFAGTKVLHLPIAELSALAASHRLVAPERMRPDDRDGWLNLLLAEVVEPHLGRQRPVLVYDYPASQAALARVRRTGSSAVAERFELYVEGVELCNGYQELTDARELAERVRRQSMLREREGFRPLPQQSRLLTAMQAARLPECAGVALGFDRLAMLALGKSRLAEVMAFPFARA